MVVPFNTLRKIVKYLLVTGLLKVIIVFLLLLNFRQQAIQKPYQTGAEEHRPSYHTRRSIQMPELNKMIHLENEVTHKNTEINLSKIPDKAVYKFINPNSKCLKKINIAFVKTHKTGSTTVSNILQRFGLNHDLNFLLPRHPNMADSFWVIKTDRLDKSSLIPLKSDQFYNLITIHTKYNKAEYDRVMPPDYYTLGIIREPEDYFVSAMFYFYPLKINQKHFPFIFDNFFSGKQSFRKQAEDFGIADNRFPDEVFMAIKNVNKTFDFVMLFEYFDESLVYLRRKFCWNLKDILYMVQNKNIMRYGYALRPEHRNRLLDILSTDYILYNHFKKKFWDMLSEEGADLFLEVHHFKTVLRSVKDFCKYGHAHTDFPLVVPASSWNDLFTVNNTQCNLMILTEPEMVDKLMKRAWKRYTT